MSSFTIFGFFALASGCRQQTLKPGTAIRTWHAHYTTTIQCVTPPYVPADLRIYSPINDILHPDNTIAFVVARVHVPHTGDILLDALHIVPCPSDPLSDSYNDAVPNFQFPMVYGLGIVSSPHETFPNGSTAFSVALSEYVRDASQQSTVQYVFSCHTVITAQNCVRCILNRTIAHWKNTPVPAVNSLILFYGICSQFTLNGMLGIEIEGITLNVGPPSQPTLTGGPPDESGSPSKKRRFQTHASPRHAASASSSSQQLYSPM